MNGNGGDGVVGIGGNGDDGDGGHGIVGRRDPYAQAYRIQVEEPKSPKHRGYYLHPELFGLSQDRSIFWAERPELFPELLPDAAEP